MKILVPVKPVADPNTKANSWLAAQQKGADGVTMVINDFDLIALEEALRIRDKIQSEVVLVSICEPGMITQVRSAVAMGANRSIVIESEGEKSWFQIAAALRKIVEQEQPDIVLMGKQATDDDASQVGPILAELLDWPQATYASQITIAEDQSKATVAREVDDGIEVLEVGLPAIITTDLRLNEPRYATLPNLIKAKKAPIDQRKWSDLGIDAGSLTQVEGYELAPGRGGAVVMVEDARALFDMLREQKVLG
ncbi:MAG: electron transfer flavoprotein subunit beta/FixA family protein [Phycisphaerae bacterium]|nr:electron transfer flavoprotein subunit beta/FixA family protein [Phycisphaerae bacterium]